MAKRSRKAKKWKLVGDGHDIFVVFDGQRVAVRGTPGTSEANTWIVLVPGYVVIGGTRGLVPRDVVFDLGCMLAMLT